MNPFPKYRIISSVLHYEYLLPSNTNIDIEIHSEPNNYKNSVLSDQLKENIFNLSKSRIFKVKIKGNEVIVENYIKINSLMNRTTEKEIRKSINGIESFYTMIVKELKYVNEHFKKTFFVSTWT